MKQNGVSDDTICLSLFPYSLTHYATAWNKITNFRQDPNESLFEAWECYKLSIDRCPNYNMLLVTQIDTFYNGLTLRHQDTINAVAGGTFMKKRPKECCDLIESMTGHHNHWDTATTRDETSRTISSTTTTERSLSSNTIANPRGDVKAITTRSGVAYDGPTIPPTSSSLPKEVEHEIEVTKDKVKTSSSKSTAHVQPSVVQVPILEPNVASKPNPKPSIPYPSRLNDQKLCEKANNQMLKFLQIFQRLHFDISFADALLYMPKFASTFKSLISNKEKLFELASTPLNENSLAVLLKKLLEKLKDPNKFLIKCDFSELEEFLALADLGASINLMPLSIWKKLLLSELTLTRMTLELENRSVAYSVGVAEDFFVKVGKYYFLADFVVVDYNVNPQFDEWKSHSFGSYHYFFFPSFTPFEGGDFILEEIETFLRTPDELSNLDNDYYDTEGDILYLEKLLNEDPYLNLPPMKNEDLKICILEGTDKLPAIISKELKDEEKVALLKILMEDDFKPAVQHQRRVNPKIYEVIKKEDIKLLYAGLIYPISDCPWVSHVHCVPKKGGITVVKNKDNVLIPTRLVTGWRVCIDYWKLNDATCKNHFSLPFMDQMLERLAGNKYYCFLDGLSGYIQIPINPQDHEKTTFTCPYGDIMVRTTPLRKSLILVSIGRRFIAMPMTWLSHVTHVNVKAKSRKRIKCPKMHFKYARSLKYGASNLWDHSRLLEGTNIFLWPLTTCLNGLKQKHYPQMMLELL
nr:DNA-directed DNA polymerase [Tanacetum cinerariifolium]